MARNGTCSHFHASLMVHTWKPGPFFHTVHGCNPLNQLPFSGPACSCCRGFMARRSAASFHGNCTCLHMVFLILGHLGCDGPVSPKSLENCLLSSSGSHAAFVFLTANVGNQQCKRTFVGVRCPTESVIQARAIGRGAFSSST